METVGKRISTFIRSWMAVRASIAPIRSSSTWYSAFPSCLSTTSSPASTRSCCSRPHSWRAREAGKERRGEEGSCGVASMNMVLVVPMGDRTCFS